jgi:hypothetical protein
MTADALDFVNLPPLFFDRGDLLCEFSGEWWRLPVNGERPWPDDGTIAVGPGHQLDQPGRARLDQGILLLNYDRTITDKVEPSGLRAIAGDGWLAWTDGDRWQVKGAGFEPARFSALASDDVLGVVLLNRQPALVYNSDGHWFMEGEERVPLEACEGPALGLALHSHLGVMAIQRDPQSVQLIQLDTGETLIEVHVG